MPGNLEAKEHEEETDHHHEDHVEEEVPMVVMANTVVQPEIMEK